MVRGLLPATLLISAFGVALSAQVTASSPGTSSSVNTDAPTGNTLESPRDRIFYPGDTESAGPLFHKLAGNFVLDQKEIWTSPFHMNRHNAKWWLLFAGATGGLIASDHWINNRIEHNSLQTGVGSNISQIGEVYTLVPAAVGLYAYGVWKHDPKPREVGVLGAQALLDSVVVVEVLKEAFGRSRPDDPHVNERSEWFSGGSSFPSGHAIMSWTLASVIAHEYQHTPGAKWVPWVAYGIAGTVSVSRWLAEKHYASDIVAGGSMGWFIGRYVYKTHEDARIHRHKIEGLQPSGFVPAFAPGTGTYGMAMNWGAGGATTPLIMEKPIPAGGPLP